MSSEVYELIKKLSLNNLNTQTAMQCAPLIAGLKASNLMTIDRGYYRQLMQIIKGTKISCYVLVMTDTRITMLMYNEEKLRAYLESEHTSELMKKFGYEDCKLEKILPVFKTRYRRYISDNKDFPHELGLLLGYPVEDVLGFIRNEGRNYLYCGYWKVYGDVDAARITFDRYNQAKEDAIRLISSGMEIHELLLYGKMLESA